jgi:hypothetical protein
MFSFQAKFMGIEGNSGQAEARQTTIDLEPGSAQACCRSMQGEQPINEYYYER